MSEQPQPAWLFDLEVEHAFFYLQSLSYIDAETRGRKLSLSLLNEYGRAMQVFEPIRCVIREATPPPRPVELTSNLEAVAYLNDLMAWVQATKLLISEHLAEAGKPPPEMTAGAPTHAQDFAWVRCEHGQFTFSARQRRVVEALWKDWEAIGAGLTGRTLLKSAGGSANRIRDVFKDGAQGTNPAWGKLIVPVKGRSSFYTLALPKRVA
jgi:hypothetical protein